MCGLQCDVSTSEHAHMTHPLLYDHQSGCLVGGTGAVLSPPRLGAGSGNNNNGANVASSILPLGGTVVPPPPAAAASSSGDNKSKLKGLHESSISLVLFLLFLSRLNDSAIKSLPITTQIRKRYTQMLVNTVSNFITR